MVSESAPPCPRCYELALEGELRPEMVQPVPDGAWAPIGKNHIKCCYDCASADTLMRLGYGGVPSWEAARIAVGNERQEQYRLPGAPMGLVLAGLVKASAPGDLEKQHVWMDRLEMSDEGSDR